MGSAVMGKSCLFPASSADKLTYCGEGVASVLYLVCAWIVTLEGEVSTEVSQRAVDFLRTAHSEVALRKESSAHDYPFHG